MINIFAKCRLSLTPTMSWTKWQASPLHIWTSSASHFILTSPSASYEMMSALHHERRSLRFALEVHSRHFLRSVGSANV